MNPSLPLRLFAAIACLVLAAAAMAQTAPAPADAEQRLKVLSDELRCLVCQNQTLADSNAALAVDLREQVRTMIGEGKTNAQIKEYLVARYGDFVLYRPPVKGTTLLLWFGPFALLLAGAVIWIVVQRRSRARREETPEPAAADRERARHLIE